MVERSSRNSAVAQKDLGKLSGDQFKRLVELMVVVLDMGAGLQQRIGAMPTERVGELVPGPWGEHYELSFGEHIALLAHALNLDKYIIGLLDEPDPQEKALSDVEVDATPNEHNPVFAKREVFGLIYSLLKSVECINAYGRSMSGLIEEVREGKSDKALFDAVRIDRGAMCAPSIAKRIAYAEMRGEEGFFEELIRAMKGRSGKIMKALDSLRFACFALREMGITNLTDRGVFELFVKQLGVYAKGDYSEKNVGALYRRFMKLNTI